MRFGHFFYPMKFDDSRDDQEIQECLDEAVLVEALGFDAIWIAEHYFTGECVYGDPLVFASAVAVKTSRVLLGFGIIELPLHNPVRVAMQTALLDNLSRGRLVVGTGNKVEDFGIGFFTKYGDGGVDLSPIADLVKTEVYQLGRALRVNQAILDAPPTDGLWGDDRSDEDQIGASYPELEWAMAFDGEEAALDARQRKVLAIYRRLNSANRHKMEPIPVCAVPNALR